MQELELHIIILSLKLALKIPVAMADAKFFSSKFLLNVRRIPICNIFVAMIFFLIFFFHLLFFFLPLLLTVKKNNSILWFFIKHDTLFITKWTPYNNILHALFKSQCKNERFTISVHALFAAISQWQIRCTNE